MAYDKHTWTCDEPITVEGLNHIEDGIANAGGGDCGFECEETVELTNETVTTIAQSGFNVGSFSYKQLINAETIRVTFDGVEYDCPRIAFDDSSMYGGVNPDTQMPDFSQYPFLILSNGTDNQIATETAGTYSIKIEGMQETVTTTQCFEKAVRSIITSPLVVKASCAPSEGTSSVPSILDASPSEIQDAVKTRGVVVEDPYGNLYSVLYATDSAVTIISSQYDSNTEPPTVLEPYMYTYEDQIHLRYPQEGGR